jgi:hypothetical protein
MSAPCKDCGMDTEPWPPRRGTQEHYLVKDEVWQKVGMPLGRRDPDTCAIRGGGGFLCVGCIEKRLGRLLTIDDFTPLTVPLLRGSENTPRLLSRAGVDPMAAASAPLPDHVVDSWLEATLTNALESHRPRVHEVKVDGDEIILVHSKEAYRYRAGPKLKAFREALRRDRIDEGFEVDLLAWETEEAA